MQISTTARNRPELPTHEWRADALQGGNLAFFSTIISVMIAMNLSRSSTATTCPAPPTWRRCCAALPTLRWAYVIAPSILRERTPEQLGARGRRNAPRGGGFTACSRAGYAARSDADVHRLAYNACAHRALAPRWSGTRPRAGRGPFTSMLLSAGGWARRGSAGCHRRWARARRDRRISERRSSSGRRAMLSLLLVAHARYLADVADRGWKFQFVVSCQIVLVPACSRCS